MLYPKKEEKSLSAESVSYTHLIKNGGSRSLAEYLIQMMLTDKKAF